MDETDRERVKYLATLLNTCAASCFSVGIVAPFAAAIYGAPTHASALIFVVGTASWFFAAVSLHLAGRRILERLRP